MTTNRRGFLAVSGLAAAGLLLPRPLAARSAVAAALQTPSSAGWDIVPDILRRIVPPTFPNRSFDITAYGARAGADATRAIAEAIDACATAGGGRVVIPNGTFLTGAIHLKTGVNLHLSDEATLKFVQDPRAYLPAVFTRFEGVELLNYSPFIYAFEQRNIAITGRGTLDGQANADTWWPWAGGRWTRTGLPSQATSRPRLIEMAARGVPVAQRTFGAGEYLRPNFIQPYRCQNVLIEGVTIVNSPMWEVHPVLSTNVTVRDLTIRTHGPNNDGCNPECSKDVLIERCSFDTGDDCIAIKSGRNDDGRRVNVAVENIVIRDCVMKDGHGGVTIGSEISGSARNIFAERCRMDSPQLDRALRFKTNSVRGGVIEHVYMRDVTVGQVAEAVMTADFYYEEGDSSTFTPVIRDVEMRRVTSQKSRYAFLLKGYARSPITDVRVIDCDFAGVAEPDVLQAVKDVRLANTRINGQLRNEVITR